MAGLSDESLLLAAAENHRVWFRRNCEAAGFDIVEVGGVELFVDREAMLFPAGKFDVDAVIAEIRARKCRGAGCWSLRANAELGTALVARGFGWGWRPHWMALDLRSGAAAAAQPEPEPFTIEDIQPPVASDLPYASPRRPLPAGRCGTRSPTRRRAGRPGGRQPRAGRAAGDLLGPGRRPAATRPGAV